MLTTAQETGGYAGLSDRQRIAFSQAVRDFRQAREKVALEIILSRLRGHPIDLLSFEDVRKKLHAQMTYGRELREISLDSIVGSVGRYSDFTRSFLPRDQADEQRWARVRAVAEGPHGFPPIEVYRIGEVYFVSDGHHRVSVARDLGSKSIEAYVTEVRTRVPLEPNDDPSDLIRKAEYTEFLETTGLDKLRPGAEIVLTEPGKYPLLERHIEIHRFLMEGMRGEAVDYPEAVADWYDSVYLPAVAAIRQQGILMDFPERSEADLYLWLSDHREDLGQGLGWQVGLDQAAVDLVEQFSQRPARVAGRVGGRILHSVIPEDLESGPPAGQWRTEVVARRGDNRLFRDVLVAIRNDEGGWQAVEQGLTIAAREGGRLLGLHVATAGKTAGNGELAAIQARFDGCLEESGLEGQLSLDEGEVARTICRRARWVDLVALSLAFPPSEERLPRLGSGLRKLIRSCPRPLLVVAGQATPLRRPLLAYDASPKSQEALFIGTYMATAWGLPLTVVSVSEGRRLASGALERAGEYLRSHGVEAQMLAREGRVADAILETAAQQEADLLLMGGYGASPMIEVVLGSEVDEVLRRSQMPMLICR